MKTTMQTNNKIRNKYTNTNAIIYVYNEKYLCITQLVQAYKLYGTFVYKNVCMFMYQMCIKDVMMVTILTTRSWLLNK